MDGDEAFGADRLAIPHEQAMACAAPAPCTPSSNARSIGANSITGSVPAFDDHFCSCQVLERRASTDLNKVIASRSSPRPYGFDAALNIPLADNAAIRLSGTDNYRPGYIDNIGLGNKNQNWSDAFGGRIALLWKPTDKLTVRTQVLTQRTADGGESTVDINLQSGLPLYGPFIQNRLTQQRQDQKFQLYSLSLDYDLDGLTLSSITSYNHIASSRQTDFSGYDGFIAPDQPLAFDNFQARTNKFTQEFRLSSDATDRLSYIIGALYTQENALLKDSEFGQKAVNVLAPDVGLTFGAYAPALYQQFAVYGDATYTVVDLRAVLRWKRSEFHLYVNNVANTRGIETITTNFIPASEGIIRPRTIGIALTERF